MMLGLGIGIQPTNGGCTLTTDEETGEPVAVCPGNTTTVTVPSSGGAVYTDASGQVLHIPPLSGNTPAESQWVKGVSNTVVVIAAAATLGLVLFQQRR